MTTEALLRARASHEPHASRNSPHSARVTGNFHFLQFHFPQPRLQGFSHFPRKSPGFMVDFPLYFRLHFILSTSYITFLVHGGWSSWTQWGACSKTCGNGKQYSRRYCNNPVPKYGGKRCYGAAVKTRECKVKPCPGN